MKRAPGLQIGYVTINASKVSSLPKVSYRNTLLQPEIEPGHGETHFFPGVDRTHAGTHSAGRELTWNIHTGAGT